MKSGCLVVNFEDMGTKRTKAPKLVQLFFSIYKVILEGESSPNTYYPNHKIIQLQ